MKLLLRQSTTYWMKSIRYLTGSQWSVTNAGGIRSHFLRQRENWSGTLHWRHNDHDGVSIHQHHGCILNRFVQTQINENIKAPRHWPLCGEFTGDRWIPRTKGQLRGKCSHLMTSSWAAVFCTRCSFWVRFSGSPILKLLQKSIWLVKNVCMIVHVASWVRNLSS